MNNKIFISPYKKIQKRLIFLLLPVIMIGSVITGIFLYQYYQDITEIKTLNLQVDEKHARFTAIEAMKEYLPSTKIEYQAIQKRFFRKEGVTEFLKSLPEAIRKKGLKIDYFTIGREEPVPEGYSDVFNLSVGMKISGNLDNILGLLRTLQNELPKELKVEILTISRSGPLHHIDLQIKLVIYNPS